MLADREQEARADFVFQRRLRIITAVVGIAATVLLGLRHVIMLCSGTWSTSLFVDQWGIANTLCCLILGFLYVALRRWTFPHRYLRITEVFVFYVAVGTALAVYIDEYAKGPETTIGLIAVFMVGRAVAVPSRALTTFLVCIPIPLTVFAIDRAFGQSYYTSGDVIDVREDLVAGHVWKHALLAFGVGVATVTSYMSASLRAQLAAARRVGSYRLEEKIGAGALGEVYRATHALLRRPTALKLLKPEVVGEETVQRFEQEVRSASRLSHPNTIRIYDYGRTPNGHFYYAMQYLPGLDLEKIVARHGPLPAARVVHVLRQACRSLSEAHALGLVHRDVKPGNLMLCVLGGDHDVVKVLDFGLVKDLEDTGPASTRTGTICGTPETLAPEVLRGQPATPRCDLYALGVVGCFLLTGKPLFEAQTAVEYMGHHLYTTPAPPSASGVEVPASLDALLVECLAKDPASRPGSAVEMGERLTAVAREHPWTQADATAWWEQNAKRARA